MLYVSWVLQDVWSIIVTCHILMILDICQTCQLGTHVKYKAQKMKGKEKKKRKKKFQTNSAVRFSTVVFFLRHFFYLLSKVISVCILSGLEDYIS